jgi:methyl-accepting chemotaxis protein
VFLKRIFPGEPQVVLSDRRLRAGVEQMPTAILIFDRSRTIVYANPASDAMVAKLQSHLGLFAGRLMGNRFEVLHPGLAGLASTLGPHTPMPAFGRLDCGAETVDYLISPVVEAGENVGHLCTWWVSTMQGKVAERFELEVKSVAERLQTTAGEVRSTSREVAGMVEAQRRETDAAGAAAAQLTAAIRDICSQLGRASQVSDKAVGEAQASDTRIGSLAKSADAIGNIVAIINEIADRTNLLALNATIEAARAGAAGKGFAVVAQEVKTLAGQTAKATADITAQVNAIQGASSEVVATIAGIGRTIEEVRGILGTISVAVDEQSAATREASGRIAHVSELATRSEGATALMTEAASRVDDMTAALRRAVEGFLESARQL